MKHWKGESGMASTKLMETKDGRRFFKITVSRGRGQSPYTTRWYWPDGWSKRAAERELAKQAAAFELACSRGEVLTRADIRRKEAEEQAEAAKLKTVRQYAVGVYMPTKETTLSENARSSYRMFLDRHILPILGDTLLTEVTPAMLTKLLVDFQRTGKSHATCVKLYNILNGLFQMAFLDDSIQINPMLKVKRPVPRKDEAAVDEAEKAYTVDEMRRILKCLKEEPLKWRTYITLMADTGIRRGEACGLNWSDVDFNTLTVTVRRNLQYTPSAGVYEAAPKNGKARVVDIGADTAVLLKQLRSEQASTCMSKYVFTQDGSPEPMHPQTPTRYFRKFGKRYGVEDFHPHKLRHTSASLAITNGADVVSVSERLGHSDTAVTLRMYAHANEESIRRAGQTVRDALRAGNE